MLNGRRYVYIKYLSSKRNIQIVWVPNIFLVGLEQLKDDKIQKESLYKKTQKSEKLKGLYLNIFPII